MGTIRIMNKPEAESFLYAYVETVEGNLVKVELSAIKKVLGIPNSLNIKITLTTTDWVQSEDMTYYTQAITIDGSTENSKVELLPTPEQLIRLMNEEVSIFIANDAGVITAYAVNGIPSIDMTFDATITEVI